jgi:hypothetical protein
VILELVSNFCNFKEISAYEIFFVHVTDTPNDPLSILSFRLKFIDINFYFTLITLLWYIFIVSFRGRIYLDFR